MGLSSSLECAPLRYLRWSWPRVLELIGRYEQGNWALSLSASDLHSFTHDDLSLEQCEKTTAMFATDEQSNPSSVNTVVFLILMISACDSLEANIDARLHSILKLVDFAQSDSLTADTVTVLLMCVCTAYSSILSRRSPSTQDIIKLSSQVLSSVVCSASGTQYRIPDIEHWTRANILRRSTTTIDFVFDFMSTGDLKMKAEKSKQSTGGAKLVSDGYNSFMQLNVLWPSSHEASRPSTNNSASPSERKEMSSAGIELPAVHSRNLRSVERSRTVSHDSSHAPMSARRTDIAESAFDRRDVQATILERFESLDQDSFVVVEVALGVEHEAVDETEGRRVSVEEEEERQGEEEDECYEDEGFEDGGVAEAEGASSADRSDRVEVILPFDYRSAEREASTRDRPVADGRAAPVSAGGVAKAVSSDASDGPQASPPAASSARVEEGKRSVEPLSAKTSATVVKSATATGAVDGGSAVAASISGTLQQRYSASSSGCSEPTLGTVSALSADQSLLGSSDFAEGSFTDADPLQSQSAEGAPSRQTSLVLIDAVDGGSGDEEYADEPFEGSAVTEASAAVLTLADSVVEADAESASGAAEYVERDVPESEKSTLLEVSLSGKSVSDTEIQEPSRTGTYEVAGSLSATAEDEPLASSAAESSLAESSVEAAASLSARDGTAERRSESVLADVVEIEGVCGAETETAFVAAPDGSEVSGAASGVEEAGETAAASTSLPASSLASPTAAESALNGPSAETSSSAAAEEAVQDESTVEAAASQSSRDGTAERGSESVLPDVALTVHERLATGETGTASSPDSSEATVAATGGDEGLLDAASDDCISAAAVSEGDAGPLTDESTHALGAGSRTDTYEVAGSLSATAEEDEPLASSAAESSLAESSVDAAASLSARDGTAERETESVLADVVAAPDGSEVSGAASDAAEAAEAGETAAFSASSPASSLAAPTAAEPALNGPSAESAAAYDALPVLEAIEDHALKASAESDDDGVVAGVVIAVVKMIIESSIRHFVHDGHTAEARNESTPSEAEVCATPASSANVDDVSLPGLSGNAGTSLSS